MGVLYEGWESVQKNFYHPLSLEELRRGSEWGALPSGDFRLKENGSEGWKYAGSGFYNRFARGWALLIEDCRFPIERESALIQNVLF